MQIAVLVLEGVFDAGLALVTDTLDLANSFASPGEGRWDVRLVALRKRVRTHRRLSVPVNSISRACPDVVIVPALGAKTPDTLDAALRRSDVAGALPLLRSWSEDGARIAAACTSTFVIAAAGLLQHRPATTTWWLAPHFRRLFPDVELDEKELIVDAGNVITAGAALAHLDLALWLVRQQSPTVARTVAQHLLCDHRSSQAPYMSPIQILHADQIVEDFEKWSRRHLANFTLRRAAREIGTTERTLERRVRAALGRSPLAFVQDLRVAKALHQMTATSATIDQIAENVGYSDGQSLRTLLRKKTGLGLRELRRRAQSAVSEDAARGAR